MTTHRQVAIDDWGGAPCEVDAGMAPLLRALWARGFRSTSSCEGSGDGCAYIALWGGREAVSDLLATVPAADAAEVGADVLGAHGTVHFPRRFLSSWPAFLSAGAGDDR